VLDPAVKRQFRRTARFFSNSWIFRAGEPGTRFDSLKIRLTGPPAQSEPPTRNAETSARVTPPSERREEVHAVANEKKLAPIEEPRI
jgi:hypothetical protein